MTTEWPARVLIPYRKPRAADEAMQELLRFAGVQFDSDVVVAFQKAFPDLEKLLI